jgi:alpha-tubulin suppressor-like RCC1 family protein
MQSGEVKCWGNNANGQLGLGHANQVLTPTTVAAVGSGVSHIALGEVNRSHLFRDHRTHCLWITAVMHCAS